ncbi:MAG: SIS domain-containing protein [Phycisphaerales bacterium]|nr:MAG: SIS domain-containing protein [Phycisphaerales bacterium]
MPEQAFDRDFVLERIDRAARVVASLAERADDLLRVAHAVRDSIGAGGKVLTCGNGGSAAEAMHLAEELIGKYRDPRRPLPAICLNADPTALTCIANDFGFDEVFARQTQALAQSGDALVVFSTSGNSPNIVRALEAARAAGATTLGLLGKGGGAALAHCDAALVVDETDTGHIQEAHQVALHLILECVERV